MITRNRIRLIDKGTHYETEPADTQALKASPIEAWREARDREHELARKAYDGELGEPEPVVGGARCSCGEPIGIVQGAWKCPRCASTCEVGMSFVMEQETITTKSANEMVRDWLATVAPDWLPDSDWKAIVMDYEQSLAISCAFGGKNYCVKKAIDKDLRRAVNAAMTELSQWLRSEQ